jgi:hypothetical protein
LAQDILINFTPMGRTSSDRTIVVPFSQPLNFRDAIMQIVTGTSRLISHCVTGVATMSVVYSSSGKEEETEIAEESVGRPRKARTTTSMAKPAAGEWGPGLTLRERLEHMNAGLNSNYMRRTESARGKLSNWPATICTTPDGYVR